VEKSQCKKTGKATTFLGCYSSSIVCIIHHIHIFLYHNGVFILTGYFLWMKGEVGKGLKWFCGLGLLWFFFTGLGAFYLDSMFKTHIIEPEEIIYNWISSISGVIIPFVCLLLAYRDSVQFSNEEE